MKVKELIEELQKVDPERIVILSTDPEGNGYSPLTGISTQYNYSDGEIGLAEITEEDRQSGYSDEDVLEGESAFILWP